MNEQSDVNGSVNGGGAGVNGTLSIRAMKKDPTDLIIGSWNDEDSEKVLS